MKLSEVSEMLMESLIPFMKEHGFKLNKRDREFSRESEDVKQLFDFFFYKKANYISVKPEVRIKIKSIEEIYKSVSSKGDRPYCTLGNHLFEIVRFSETGTDTERGELSDWMIEDEDDVRKLGQVIPEYFRDSILPYFDKNSSVERVDKLLNRSPRDMTIHNWLYPLRANIAIIAAKLNGNPKFEELLDIYNEETEEAEETYREEFLKLKAVLTS